MAIKDQPADLGEWYEPVGGAPGRTNPGNVHPAQPFGASGGAPARATAINTHPLAANIGWLPKVP